MINKDNNLNKKDSNISNENPIPTKLQIVNNDEQIPVE